MQGSHAQTWANWANKVIKNRTVGVPTRERVRYERVRDYLKNADGASANYIKLWGEIDAAAGAMMVKLGGKKEA